MGIDLAIQQQTFTDFTHGAAVDAVSLQVHYGLWLIRLDVKHGPKLAQHLDNVRVLLRGGNSRCKAIRYSLSLNRDVVLGAAVSFILRRHTGTAPFTYLDGDWYTVKRPDGLSILGIIVVELRSLSDAVLEEEVREACKRVRRVFYANECNSQHTSC